MKGGDFKLNNFQDGLLSSEFLVGLLVVSPLIAYLAKSYNPFRLLGVGLSVWTIFTALCGASFNFWTIAICRMLVGVGEASFISLAPPCIVDVSPVAQKTAWLGAFFMCIPAGFAFGYVLGGLVATHLIWHWAFFGESIIILPWTILCFFLKPVGLKDLFVVSLTLFLDILPVSSVGSFPALEKLNLLTESVRNQLNNKYRLYLKGNKESSQYGSKIWDRYPASYAPALTQFCDLGGSSDYLRLLSNLQGT